MGIIHNASKQFDRFPNKGSNFFIDDDKEENINDAYAETLNEEVGGLQPWLVVLATFLVLVVGLGAGTGW